MLQVFFRLGLMFAIAVAPQYLARTQGYRVDQLAPLLAPLALATLLAAPLAYWFAVKFDARIALSIGLGLFSLTAAWCASISPDWAAEQFFWPLIVIGVGQAFFGIATLRFATFGIGLAEGPTVGVIFNFARIFGLAGGLALVSHTVVEREKFHSARLVERLTDLDPGVAQRLAGQASTWLPQLSDGAASQRAGVAGLARSVGLQAFTLAYADAFAVIAAGLLAAAILVWALPFLAPVPRTFAPPLERRPS